MRSLRLFVVLALAALSGCAGLQRDQRARELAGEYVYPRPISEVWPHVEALLTSQGYLPHRGETGEVMETDWKQEVAGSKSGGAWSRYVVVGKGNETSSVVRILRNTRAVESDARANESDDGQALTNDSEGGRAVEQARYGSDANAGPLKHDQETSAIDSIAGTRATSAPNSKLAGTRDLNMEWLLLQRVDPEGAAKIYAQTESK